MSRPRINSHTFTLRIAPQLDDMLTEACWDHRTTKAAWIRAAIRKSLGLDRPLPERMRKETTR
jgi:hypothetical protein